MKKNIFFVLLTMIACNKNHSKMAGQRESPLAIVVKLISAESMGYPEVAKRYIDVNQVYSKHVPDSINYDTLFTEHVKIMSSTTNSNKMSNHFKYFNYEIVETYEGGQAKVKFAARDNSASLERIIYSLEDRQGEWIVVDIDYVRNNN
jgi:hypothetical protein